MLRTILKYGLIAGLVVGLLMFFTFGVFGGEPPMKYGMVIGYTTMLIALSASFVGIKMTAEMDAFKIQYADPLFRLPMTFAEIFPVGILVSLISAGLLRNSRFLPAR